MTAKLLMLQGTASSVGKSLLVAALCRIFRQDGLRVAPFKAQNMSNNAFVTEEGGEIGRAQAVQAHAAQVAPHVDMNPILLKPQAEARSQVVVLGKASETLSAREYYQRKQELWPVVTDALERLRTSHDVVIIEGAGSPAEINLKQYDIVNMRVARETEAPVILVGDIDRGGVFAHLVGTLELLEQEERALVRGLLINKFRGDKSLLTDGLTFIQERTGAPVLGVVPYLRDHGVPEEDSVALDNAIQADGRGNEALLDIVVIRLPHIANTNDFEALAAEPAVHLRYVSDPAALGDPDLVILPGSKSTIEDLLQLRKRGLAKQLMLRAGEHKPILGVCGGYQMLGYVIRDPNRVESAKKEAPGLGLLPIETVFQARKITEQVEGTTAASPGMLSGASGSTARGYEIHSGVSTTLSAVAPLFRLSSRGGNPCDELDGAVSPDGTIAGTYMHGLFDEADFRQAFLRAVARHKGLPDLPLPEQPSLDTLLDRLAAQVRANLDMRQVYQITGVDV